MSEFMTRKINHKKCLSARRRNFVSQRVLKDTPVTKFPGE